MYLYQPADFLRTRLDVGITWGHGRWPEVETTLVLPTHYTPVCSPSFLGRLGATVEPRDLLRCQLFYEMDRAHWQQWFRAAGIMEPEAFDAVQIDDSHALRRVALDGHGFALFFAEQIHEDVRTGQLVRPFDTEIDPGCAYYLIRPRGVPESPALEAFTRWLLDEVSTSPYV
jgi:DNA-binding transcriptional LysR family regulator